MSPSATPSSPSSSPTATSQNADNDLQPFFVLHKAPLRKPEKFSPIPQKTRRKIDLSSSSLKSKEKPRDNRVEDEDDRLYHHFRMEAFDLVWSNIETSIEAVLRQIYTDLFSEVHRWVGESFDAIKSYGTLGFSQVTQPYPIVTDDISIQIFTALVLTKNAEFVDDLTTFRELGMHLKSHGSHVANLSSLDFTIKNGIAGCLKSLLRQLVTVTLDVADIAILATWYTEIENNDKPVTVIIDDMERCNGTILADFITMIREWVVKIPVIFIMGVATTVDAPTKLLASNALQCLQLCKFTLGSPMQKMDAIIEKVLVKPCIGFDIGYKVAAFLKNYFLKHDGTITSFIRALKIACIKHFSMEPLSFLSIGMLEDDSEDFWIEKCELLSDGMIKYALGLPSYQSDKTAEKSGDELIHHLLELKRARKKWSSVVMCLFEVAKLQRMQLLDIFCEALNPDFYNLRPSDYFLMGGKVSSISSSKSYSWLNGNCSDMTRGRFIAQAVHKVRDVTTTSLAQLLEIWAKHTEEIAEVYQKVKELQLLFRLSDEGKSFKEEGTDIQGKLASRSRVTVATRSLAVNEKAAKLLECMVRDYLLPLECTPFHEIVCFKETVVLQSALIGDPRRTIQLDLLKSRTYLCCKCCTVGGSVLLPTMHDTSIMYNLAQDHGDLINLHDWYQSFKDTVLSLSTRGKNKGQQSSISRKRKSSNVVGDANEASIQARFCRAVTELQITGLLRMLSKRRPDFVQRVAFGL